MELTSETVLEEGLWVCTRQTGELST